MYNFNEFIDNFTYKKDFIDNPILYINNNKYPFAINNCYYCMNTHLNNTDILNRKNNTLSNLQCSYCKTLSNFYGYHDIIINQKFNINNKDIIIINNKITSLYVNLIDNNIISDYCSNKIYINYLLQKYNLSVDKIYMSYICNRDLFIIKDYYTKNWINTELDFKQLINLIDNLEKYKFISFDINDDLFKLDNNNNIYLCNYKNASINYDNYRFLHIYNNLVFNVEQTMFLDIDNLYFKFYKPFEEYNMIDIYYYMNYIHYNKYPFTFIIQKYLYILYYLYFHKDLYEKYERILWISDEINNIKKQFYDLKSVNVKSLLILLSKFTLKKNLNF